MLPSIQPNFISSNKSSVNQYNQRHLFMYAPLPRLSFVNLCDTVAKGSPVCSVRRRVSCGAPSMGCCWRSGGSCSGVVSALPWPNPELWKNCPWYRQPASRVTTTQPSLCTFFWIILFIRFPYGEQDPDRTILYHIDEHSL